MRLFKKVRVAIGGPLVGLGILIAPDTYLTSMLERIDPKSIKESSKP